MLRPFKAINHLENLKRLSLTLIKSIKGLFHVWMFLMFVFSVFGVLGISFYKNSFYFRCRETEHPIDGHWPKSETYIRICSPESYIGYQCPSDGEQQLYCGNAKDNGIYLYEDGAY